MYACLSKSSHRQALAKAPVTGIEGISVGLLPLRAPLTPVTQQKIQPCQPSQEALSLVATRRLAKDLFAGLSLTSLLVGRACACLHSSPCLGSSRVQYATSRVIHTEIYMLLCQNEGGKQHRSGSMLL